MSLIEVQNVSFFYQLDLVKVQALKQVTINIPANSFVGLVGPSGSGKTTLLNLIGLIEPLQSSPPNSDILWAGSSLRQLNERQKNRLRLFDIGFVFQAFNLFPTLSAFDNVQYFLLRQGVGKKDRAARAQEALEIVDLWDQRTQRPLQLSGGQRQRVAIARALAKRPKLLIADEPTASLDQDNARRILQSLQRLQDLGTSVLLSSHDPMAESFLQQKITLQDGQIQPLQNTLSPGGLP